ncbi:hypothetical protein CLCAR_0042 [Clostridium carboxidivorans P7]|nr:hypothetical protein CLCAR_0042 [Clostridium carboxidivorans P7]
MTLLEQFSFFGGEPLMNFQVIEYICNYFNQLKNENKIDYIPRFAVITNGTTITDQIIDMLIKYNFTITISIDGDEFIQNYLRIDKLGHGTFNKINEKYKQLIEKGFPKNSIGLECTYTKAHIDKKISFVDLLNYFHTNFGIDIVHIAPVCIDSNNKLSLSNYQDIIINYTKELVDYSFDTILNEKSIKSSSFVLGILDRLISNTQVPYICPAGLNSVSVAKDGIIRPCFVFSGSDISIGNLQSTMDELKDNLKDFTLKYNEKHLYEKCKECYARNVCSSCLTSYGDNLDEPDFYHGADSMCTIMKTMISSILLRLSEIKSNKENWNTLNEVLNKYSTCHYC